MADVSYSEDMVFSYGSGDMSEVELLLRSFGFDAEAIGQRSAATGDCVFSATGSFIMHSYLCVSKPN